MENNNRDFLPRPRPKYVPRYAVVFYGFDMGEGVGGTVSHWYASDKTLAYATFHEIIDGKLCAGSPVKKGFLEQLSCKFKVAKPAIDSRNDFIPEQVLFFSEQYGRIAWWKPAGTQHVAFADNALLGSGKAKLPPLLFRYFDKQLRVYVLKEDRRPSLSTPVYKTIFFNNGCMGDVKMPVLKSPSDIYNLEEIFFRSEFTLSVPPLLAGGYNGISLWRRLIQNKLPFPMRALVPAGALDKILGE